MSPYTCKKRYKCKMQARIYMRVSTNQQDLTRQEELIEQVKSAGGYIAGIYREKASGATRNRPELQRMIADLQVGDVIVAEKIDRISRLPLPEAELLVNEIKEKGAKLLIPDVIDFSDIISATEDSVSKIVLQAMQDLLLKLALQIARDDYLVRRKRMLEGIKIAKEKNLYKGRRSDKKLKQEILKLLDKGVAKTFIAQTLKCSRTTIWRIEKAQKGTT